MSFTQKNLKEEVNEKRKSEHELLHKSLQFILENAEDGLRSSVINFIMSAVKDTLLI